MPRSLEDILDVYHRRKADMGLAVDRMRQITRLYNNEIAVPLPEIDRSEDMHVANFLGMGIDGHGQRIASVQPDIRFPVVKRGKQQSQNLAATRRRAAFGWLQVNDMNLMDRRRARQLIAYATAPVVIRPSKKTGQPLWEVRNPLDCYPSQTANPDDMDPDDVIFGFTRGVDWLARRYPNVVDLINSGRKQGERLKDTDEVEIVEYIDDQERVLIATGQGRASARGVEAEYGINGARIVNIGMGGKQQFAVELERTVNRAEICTAVVPGRISLAGRKGQFDDSRGLFQQMAKLMALEVHAVGKSVFPDTWFVHGAEGGEIIRVADGLRGVVGEIKGGQLDDRQLTPGFQTYPTIDRFERSLRLNMALPPEMGGESGSNIRTDRRGQTILSEAIDFHVQEHQEILAKAREHEIERAIAVDLGYFRTKRKSFYVTWPGAQGRLDYRPVDIWDDDRTVIVRYAMTGMDANQLLTASGQAIGTGTMSKLSAMRMNPLVEDPEWEHGQIIAEGVEAAMLSGLQQQASTGDLTPPDLARLSELLEDGTMSLAAAVQKVHEEAQTRQAPAVNPVEPGAPEAQPGIAQPGQGAEAGTAIQAPAPSLENMRNLLGVLGRARTFANQG